jgi:bacillolysin
MKNIYLILVICVLTISVQAQKINPFDARSKKSTSPAIHDAAVLNAGVIDGSKSTSNSFYKPVLFTKPTLQDNPNFSFIQPPAAMTPVVIYRKPGSAALNKASQNVNDASYAFLNEAHSLMKINNPEKEFAISKIDNDALGMTHVRLQQLFNSVPVYGAEVILHGTNNSMDYMNGNYVPTPVLASVIPARSAAEAVSAMSVHLNKQTKIVELSTLQKLILHYNGAQVTLVILPVIISKNIQYKLAYQIIVRPDFMQVWNYFIDANDLSVLDFYNGTCDANGPRTATANDLNGVNRTIQTYEYNGNFYCVDASRPMFNASASTFPDNGVGVIETFNANNTSGSSLYEVTSTNNATWTPTATSAQFTAGIAFDYYKNTFSRNSINGAGGTIISIINVTDQNAQALDNAYWNGQAMFYGNGNVAFKPLAGAIDVGGHEMTHGVIQSTANLEYKSQSGAINESMADVFGCMMDKANWTMGEAITKTSYIATGCLRDLSNPHNGNGNGYQPATMSEYNNTTSDNGGVHINSGIPNHAFYYFATATTKQKAEQVYYRALTSYLTKTSQFLDLRYAIVKAATDLYGAASAEVAAAKNAFDQVEIFDPNGNTGGGTGGGTTQTAPSDLQTNPGADFILSYDLSGAPSKLYSSSTAGQNYVAITATDQIRRVTVPDNGTYCLFLDLNGDIRSVNLTSPFAESILTNGGGFGNISISKDGKLLAAVSTSIDTAIYIYNFSVNLWKKVHLYNPTYSNVNTAGVDFADGLEWDNTGQYVIYDAHNKITNNSGSDLTYYDVGIVKVWDLKTNDWGDGKIEKLFTDLPEGISVGNAIFSKNSPYIIAFDYIDNSGTSPVYAILGTNIITNKTSVITANAKLGYPNYSKTDTKLIYDDYDVNYHEDIFAVNLNADKISAVAGGSTMVVPDGKWGYWYATGSRSLLSSSKDILAFSISNTSPPMTATISGSNITATVSNASNLSSLVATFSLSYNAYAKVSGVEQLSGVTSNNFSVTKTYTITAQDGTTKNYNVTITKSSAGINNNANSASFAVYPNPFKNEIIINYDGDFSYEVSDITGKKCNISAILQNGSATINTTGLASGIYFIKLSNANETRVFKMVKE